MTKRKIKATAKESKTPKLSRNIGEYQSDSKVSFSFKYLQPCSYPDCKDAGFFVQFIQRLGKLSQLGWNEIAKADRHGFGMEKIPNSTIKPQLPDTITDDVTLLVFKATGDNKPFVGFRDGNIFHIVFIETKFGDVYSHGR